MGSCRRRLRTLFAAVAEEPPLPSTSGDSRRPLFVIWVALSCSGRFPLPLALSRSRAENGDGDGIKRGGARGEARGGERGSEGL